MKNSITSEASKLIELFKSPTAKKNASSYWNISYLLGDVVIKSRLYAQNIREVRREVRERGGVLMAAEPHIKRWYHKEVFSDNFRLVFLDGLIEHIEIGMSPGAALEISIKSIANTRIQAQLTPAIDALKHGHTFLEALTALDMFDDSVCAMMSSGEMTGNIKESILEAKCYLEKKNVWVREWMAFGIVVLFEVFSVIGVLNLITNMWIPNLLANLPSTKNLAELENYKSTLILVQNICYGILWATCAVVIATIFGYIVYQNGSRKLGLRIERWLLLVPGMRSLIIDESLSLTFSLLSQMMNSRVKLSNAIDILISHSKTPSVQEMWKQVKLKQALGKSLSNSFNHRFISSTDHMRLNYAKSSLSLSKSMKAIANERAIKAKQGRDFAKAFYLNALIAYCISAALIGFWLLTIQGKGLDMSIVASMVT